MAPLHRAPTVGANRLKGHLRALCVVCHACRAVQAALFYPALDAGSIWSHLQTVEDTEALRQALSGLGLVGFVGDGAILPRKR
jgi:predicted ABC-class ATPase